MMKAKANDKQGATSSTNVPRMIRKNMIIFLISAATVLAIRMIYGWRSLEKIGTGFLYGSLGLVLLGALLLAGNTLSR
jgi:hypothetical protein